MSTHDDIEPETDRAIDELLDAAYEEGLSDPVVRPPFGAVLGRARRLDPTLARPSFDTTGAHDGSDDEDTLTALLEPFVSAARAEAEHGVAIRKSQGSPGLPRPSRGLATRWTVVVGGVLATAAAVILLLGLLDVQSVLRADAQIDNNQALDQARVDRPLLEAATGGDPVPGLAARPRHGRIESPLGRSLPDHVLPHEPAPLEDVAPPTEVIPEEPAPLEAPPPAGAGVTTPAPAPEVAPAVAPVVDDETLAARRAARARRSLQRLDDQATTRLAAGDTIGAEKAYRALVRKGGRSGLAELAYGDLFTLAHGRRDHATQQRLWREYLRKFPHGRFADDARAGLCRSQAGDQGVECWERYLDDFPTGAYHRQAEHALRRE